jgi:hypothetical protein
VEIDGCLSNHVTRVSSALAGSEPIAGGHHVRRFSAGPLAGAWNSSAVHSAVTLKAVIDRTAYGVSRNADLPSGGRALSDEVELTAELEFIRAA